MAPQPKTAQPTTEQLAAAKEAFAKFEARYVPDKDPETKDVLHLFIMPDKTSDMNLKGLPDLPFGFALILHNTGITDAGLK
jgi:hypothetical protein